MKNTEEFRILYEKMHQGDNKARDEIILKTLPLIKTIVREDYHSKLSIKNDLESIAILSLYKILLTYDINKGDFTSYVSRCVHQNINKYLTRQESKWDKLDSLNEIMINCPSNNISTFTLADLAYTINIPSVEEKVELIEEYQLLNYALNILPPFDKKVVELRFGFVTGYPLTLDAIKNIMGYQTISACSRIVNRSLAKIKNYLQTGVITEQDEKNILLNYLLSLSNEDKGKLLITLNKKEQLIMQKYLGISTKPILNGQEISNQLGISHSHVNRLIETSLQKLKQ